MRSVPSGARRSLMSGSGTSSMLTSTCMRRTRARCSDPATARSCGSHSADCSVSPTALQRRLIPCTRSCSLIIRPTG
eukprot:scaffold2419_cov58-Phaeocystis_antarctica.AAC.2